MAHSRARGGLWRAGPWGSRGEAPGRLAQKGFERNAKNSDPVAVRISVFQTRKQTHRSQDLGCSHRPGRGNCPAGLPGPAAGRSRLLPCAASSRPELRQALRGRGLRAVYPVQWGWLWQGMEAGGVGAAEGRRGLRTRVHSRPALEPGEENGKLQSVGASSLGKAVGAL